MHTVLDVARLDIACLVDYLSIDIVDLLRPKKVTGLFTDSSRAPETMRSTQRKITSVTALPNPDGLKRCTWAKGDPFYVAYHDEEWGVPEYDDRALFEKLMLDGFQAGLSWITILRKRENFRKAFDNFMPEKIARYTARKLEALMKDEGIVRNRAKIEGSVSCARAYLEIMEKGPGFSTLLWDYLGGVPRVNSFRTSAQIPTENATFDSNLERSRQARF